jgi:hypothetical protein
MKKEGVSISRILFKVAIHLSVQSPTLLSDSFSLARSMHSEFLVENSCFGWGLQRPEVSLSLA